MPVAASRCGRSRTRSAWSRATTDEPLVDRLVAESDAVVHFAAETHVDNSLTDPAAFLRNNVIGTYWCSRRCASTGAPTSHLHRRGLRRPATQRAGALHRRDAVQPVSPYWPPRPSADLAGAGMGAVLRRAGDHLELLQQLRALIQHVEKFIPRQITNVLTGRRPKLTAPGPTSGTGFHVDDHNSAVWRILQDGGAIGRTYLDRRRRRTRQPLGAADDPPNQLMGRDPDDFDHVADRPWLRPACDRLRARCGLSWDGRPKHTDFARVSQAPSSGTATTSGGGHRSKQQVGSRLRRNVVNGHGISRTRPFRIVGVDSEATRRHRGGFEWFTASGFAEMTGHRFRHGRQTARCLTRRVYCAACTSPRCPEPGQIRHLREGFGVRRRRRHPGRVPTYGRWDSVVLDDVNRRSIYLSEVLAHGFVALQDDATVMYLCSTPLRPET